MIDRTQKVECYQRHAPIFKKQRFNSLFKTEGTSPTKF